MLCFNVPFSFFAKPLKEIAKKEEGGGGGGGGGGTLDLSGIEPQSQDYKFYTLHSQPQGIQIEQKFMRKKSCRVGWLSNSSQVSILSR